MLALYLRKNLISYEKALRIQSEAELLMAGNEYDMKSLDVLSLVNRSNCSAYDCEYVALAMNLGVKLFTMDKKVIAEFPLVVESLKGVEL